MQTALSSQEIAAQGRALYAEKIRAQVEPQHLNDFLMVDVQSGDYEVDSDDLAAEERLFARRPQAVIYQMRVGSSAAYFMGSDFS